MRHHALFPLSTSWAPVLLLFVCCELGWAGDSKRAESLKQALADADRIEVSNPEFGPEDQNAKPFVFNGGPKIASLVASLDFDDANSGFHCMCDGDSLVSIFQGDTKVAVLSHHHGRSLRWDSKAWEGDSLFTQEAAKAWRTWFQEQGEPRFEDMHLRAEKEAREQAEIEGRFMAALPPGASAIFEKSRNDESGMLSFSPESGAGDSKPSRHAKELAQLFKSHVEMGVALCRAFGSLALRGASVGSWSVSSPREQLALDCAGILNSGDFQKVLEKASNEELLGAARLFFFQRFAQKIDEAKRAQWAAKLARIVIEKDRCGNSSSAIRALKSYPCDETTVLLKEVAGEFIQVATQGQYDEPSSRAAACLVLAELGGQEVAGLAEDIAKEAKLGDLDRAALKVARALAGKGTLDASIFKVDSFTIAFGALAALEKQGGRDALDAIIHGGTEHMYAAIREESVLAVERLTGKKWYQNDENERAEWHGKKIREWWKSNRETFELPLTK